MNFTRAALRARARVRAQVRGRRRQRTDHAAERAMTTPATGAVAVAGALAVGPSSGAMTHAEVRTVFFGLMLTAFLAALNQTIIATALPTIGRLFSDFENLPWVVTAYLLTSTAVAPLYGKLSDIYGRSAMLLAAVGLFVAGSIAVRGRAQHDDAHLRPRPAGHRWRRHPAALPGGDRRRGRAARARPLPGLHGCGVGDVGRRAARCSAA